MATPEQIIPILEGMVGFQTGSADGGSIQGGTVVTEWVRLVKEMLKGPNFRYLTDLQFKLTPTLTDATSEGDDSATDLIAALVEVITTLDSDSAGWLAFHDADATVTVDGASMSINTIVATINLVDVATTGVSEFYPMIWLAGSTDGADTQAYGTTGIRLTTGLSFGYDGNDGASISSASLRVWVLYRT